MDRLLLKRALQSPSQLRSSAAMQLVSRAPSTTRALSTFLRVAEPSFWKSLIPKPWRRENRPIPDASAAKKSWLAKEWNPATFYVIIFMLIGSMSIQMIALRKTFDTHTRRSDVRIGLLREVVEKLQKGEQVDVEKALGSGEPEKEAAWDELLKDIEKDAATRNQKKQEKAKTPERPPSSSTTKIASGANPTSDYGPAKEQLKDQTTYFF